jgi:hypothetical protein
VPFLKARSRCIVRILSFGRTMFFTRKSLARWFCQTLYSTVQLLQVNLTYPPSSYWSNGTLGRDNQSLPRFQFNCPLDFPLGVSTKHSPPPRETVNYFILPVMKYTAGARTQFVCRFVVLCDNDGRPPFCFISTHVLSSIVILLPTCLPHPGLLCFSPVILAAV